MQETTTNFGLYLSDLNRDKNDSHGIINYAIGLANALPGALEPGEHLHIYANPAITRELDPQTSDQVTIRQTPAPTTMQRVLSDHILGVRRAVRDGVSVLHFPKGFVPIIPSPGLRLVATLHDDIPLMYARGDFGAEYSSLKSHYFTFSLRHTLRKADALVTVSDTSLKRFMDLAKEKNITMPPSFVSHQGITLPLGDPVPVQEKKPVFLHIGSNKPHKRSYEAVQFMLKYADQSEVDFRITITGPLTRETELLLQERAGNRIKRTLPSPELARLIRESRVLIFNSEREGFGLPPVEAYALGTPAVFPLIDVMTEVLGDTPGSYEPKTFEDFARAMDTVLGLDSQELLGIRAGILERYNWQTVATETIKAYRQVAAGG